MDIEKEKAAFLGIYKYYPSAIKFTFDVENECFVLSKKNPLDHEVEVMSQMNQQWQAWFRRAKLEYENGCVVVPAQCPDPDFADSLFDELSKKAIGEFGDDLLIHFSDIDEEKIWALMVEAAKAQAVPGQICVTRERLQELIEIGVKAALKAQAVPEGFVLMPKEPSQEIIQAGLDVVRESWDDNPPHGFNSFMWGDMVATWEAMIEAKADAEG